MIFAELFLTAPLVSNIQAFLDFSEGLFPLKVISVLKQ